MSKLRTDLTYIKKCGYCGDELTYIMRARHVNSDMSDEDAIRLAVQHVGDTEGGHCENCNLFTQHTVVAYCLPEVKS